MVAVAVCSTIAYVLMIAAVMGTVSGVGLLFAVPACLLIIYIPFFSTMLHAAAVTYVALGVEIASPTLARSGSVTHGRVPTAGCVTAGVWSRCLRWFVTCHRRLGAR